MSLLAAVIHFHSEQALSPWLGRAAQAWLLEAVRRVDPALAEALHGGQSRRSYTISVPRGDPADRWLRITSLSADLTAVLTEAILPRLDRPIRLADAEIQVTAVETGGHPWAGRSDFETLARASFDLGPPDLHPGFEFATPTAFHHDGLVIPLPLPALVYGGLIHAWNSFSPLPLPASLDGFAGRYVGVARHRIATRMVQFGQSERHVGFTGTASFAIVPQERTGLTVDEYRQRVQALDLLARFAFYAGIGLRTAVGMGQARPL
jgi:CRISPR-associated endoribonuclease Cas6